MEHKDPMGERLARLEVKLFRTVRGDIMAVGWIVPPPDSIESALHIAAYRKGVVVTERQGEMVTRENAFAPGDRKVTAEDILDFLGIERDGSFARTLEKWIHDAYKTY